MSEPDCTTSEGAERASRAAAIAADWLASNSMRELLTTASSSDSSHHVQEWLHLNETVPGWVEELALSGVLSSKMRAADSSIIDALRLALALERPASDLFNFRGDGSTYRERAQAERGMFSEDVRSDITRLTNDLGLVEPLRPEYPRYDMTLILGGGYRSPLLRARYAAQLEAGGTDLGDIYLLGSPRFMIADPPEEPVVADYAPQASDEYDLMIAAAASELGFVESPTEFLCGSATADITCERWNVPSSDEESRRATPPEYTHERAMRLLDRHGSRHGYVLSASTGRPPFRPDTTDTFDLWARFAHPPRGARALVVTTQVFVPFQRFDGMRRLFLELGVDVDTVGYGAEWGDRILTAEYLLQETLSAIRSARRMLTRAAELSAMGSTA